MKDKLKKGLGALLISLALPFCLGIVSFVNPDVSLLDMIIIGYIVDAIIIILVVLLYFGIELIMD